MPQVDKAVAKARAARLRAAGDAALAAHLDRFIGQTLPVLIEKDRMGRLENFASVMVEGNAPLRPGALINVRLNRTENGKLYGEIPG